MDATTVTKTLSRYRKPTDYNIIEQNWQSIVVASSHAEAEAVRDMNSKTTLLYKTSNITNYAWFLPFLNPYGNPREEYDESLNQIDSYLKRLNIKFLQNQPIIFSKVTKYSPEKSHNEGSPQKNSFISI